MLKNIITSILVVCLTSTLSFGQKTVKLKINHMLYGDAFAFSKKTSNNIGTEFNVSRLEYYITNVFVIHDGGKETQSLGFAALIDASKSDVLDLGEMDLTTIEGIRFYVGVDGERNHADPTKYASDHPLAPRSPAMHWGWSAGYRFVAMEGFSGTDMKTKYEVHALGDKLYFPVGLTTGATDDSGNKLITINANYAKALQNIDVSTGPITHGDMGEAITLLQNFRNEVYKTLAGTGNTLSTPSFVKEAKINVYPNPSNSGVFNISTSLKIDDNAKMEVTDLMGKVILDKTVLAPTITITEKGMYLLKVSNDLGESSIHKVIVH